MTILNYLSSINLTASNYEKTTGALQVVSQLATAEQKTHYVSS